jgi:hypothetical protein
VSGFLREVGHRPERPARDPLGKAALFSGPDSASGSGPVVADDRTDAVDSRRLGTVVVECSACSASTRVSYVDFAIDALPFSIWLPPLRALQFNRRMTCPACGEWAWVRAHWLA